MSGKNYLYVKFDVSERRILMKILFKKFIANIGSQFQALTYKIILITNISQFLLENSYQF